MCHSNIYFFIKNGDKQDINNQVLTTNSKNRLASVRFSPPWITYTLNPIIKTFSKFNNHLYLAFVDCSKAVNSHKSFRYIYSSKTSSSTSIDIEIYYQFIIIAQPVKNSTLPVQPFVSNRSIKQEAKVTLYHLNYLQFRARRALSSGNED